MNPQGFARVAGLLKRGMLGGSSGEQAARRVPGPATPCSGQPPAAATGHLTRWLGPGSAQVPALSVLAGCRVACGQSRPGWDRCAGWHGATNRRSTAATRYSSCRSVARGGAQVAAGSGTTARGTGGLCGYSGQRLPVWIGIVGIVGRSHQATVRCRCCRSSRREQGCHRKLSA